MLIMMINMIIRMVNMTTHLSTLAAVRLADVKEIDSAVKCKAHLSNDYYNDDDDVNDGGGHFDDDKNG